jgi:hypothetical protein
MPSRVRLSWMPGGNAHAQDPSWRKNLRPRFGRRLMVARPRRACAARVAFARRNLFPRSGADVLSVMPALRRAPTLTRPRSRLVSGPVDRSDLTCLELPSTGKGSGGVRSNGWSAGAADLTPFRMLSRDCSPRKNSCFLLMLLVWSPCGRTNGAPLSTPQRHMPPQGP